MRFHCFDRQPLKEMDENILGHKFLLDQYVILITGISSELLTQRREENIADWYT